MHWEGVAEYGSLHPYKEYRDNIGIGHLPAGTGNNLQGLPDEADNRRKQEDFGLAHEPIGAMMEG